MWTQEEEAAKLLKRFNELKLLGVGQAQFARDFKVPGGPSMLSQHIKNRRPLNLEAALAYAEGFGCELVEISPRLAQEVASAARAAGLSTDKPWHGANPVSENNSQIETDGVAQAIVVLRDALGTLSDEARETAALLMGKMASQPTGTWAERLIDLMKAEQLQQSASSAVVSLDRPVKPLITGPTGATTMKSGNTGKTKQRLTEGLLSQKEAHDEPRKPGRISKGKAR